MHKMLIGLAGALMLFVSWSSVAAAQEELDPEAMRRLVRQISHDMKVAESTIIRAGAETREAQESAIEKLAELAQVGKEQQGNVIEGIDRLIEASRLQPGSCSSGQCEKPGSGFKRPSNGPRRDGLKRTGEERKPNDRKQPLPDLTKPGGDQPSDDPSQQQNSDEPPASQDEEKGHRHRPGSWGSLPDKIQERVRTFDPNQYPQKYRRWLDEYLRGLNDVDRG